MKRDPATLPDFEMALARIAFEVMGYEDVTVSPSGDTITCTDPDGEPVTDTVQGFLRDVADMIDAASEGV